MNLKFILRFCFFVVLAAIDTRVCMAVFAVYFAYKLPEYF